MINGICFVSLKELGSGFFSCAGTFRWISRSFDFCFFFNKGEIQTINHQNVLQVWETVNISVLSIWIAKWMWNSPNVAGRESHIQFTKFGTFLQKGMRANVWEQPTSHVRLKDTLSNMKERVRTG
jgi:hypothetical protein